jgi:replicative DNA helicase
MRELPHDPHAERSVLGGCFLAADALARVEPIVAPEDFFDPRHATVFDCVRAVSARNEPVDVVTVVAELKARGKLNAVGGAQFLGELTDEVFSTAHLDRHARMVADAARLRRMVAAAQAVAAKGLEPGAQPDALAEFGASTFLDAGEKRGGGELVSFDQSIDETMTEILNTLERGKPTGGVEFGFRQLDELTTGMQPGELGIVAARPAMGKTAFAMGVVLRTARLLGPVLFISEEMPHKQLTRRVLAAEAGVDQMRLRRGRFVAGDVEALTGASVKNYRLPIYYADAGGATIHTVRAHARRLRQRKGLALIVVDYLQLMSGAGEENRQQEISTISRGLKTLAKNLNVPVLALSQLNRSSATRSDKRPQLSDLRESGAIEQDADLVLMLHREEVYDANTPDKGIAEVLIAKQRNGPFPETVRLKFVRELTRFEELEADQPSGEYGTGYEGGEEDAAQ